MKKMSIFIDDSGSRVLTLENSDNRNDGIDGFALGGIIIKNEDISDFILKHKEFCDVNNISYPLHSSSIRGRKRDFGWLNDDRKREDFMNKLDRFLISLPFVAIAVVIDRKGYISRYQQQYGKNLWQMCKTAYSILIERAARYAVKEDCALEIFFEQSGKKEDRAIISYSKELKSIGMPFGHASQLYNGLSADDFKRIILGDPDRKTKDCPMTQIADLILYPIVKNGYQPNYRPYNVLHENGKLIDSFLDENEIPLCGIKYSCFKYTGQS